MADKNQLDIETQINAAIRDRAALMEQQKRQLSNQIALAQELCRALECKELEGYNERMQATREGLLQAAEASDQATESTQNMGVAMQKSSKKAGLLKGAAVGAAVAIKNVFGMAVKVVKSLGSALIGIVKGGFNLVRGAFQAYNKVLGFMANKSREGADASLGLRNSIEDLKEQFGALDSGVGQLVTKTFAKFKAEGGNLAGTGLRLSKVFGRGPDGLANLNKFLGEQFAGLGANMDRLGAQFAEGASEALILNKALGFQGEDFERLGIIAGHAGETLKETMGRLSREIVTVSDRFGVNSRVMSKNISIMMKSPAVFGTNTKEMIKTSVAAQKLGMSIEELSGPMKVFDDFESGAKAAAMLAAEFGIFVDSAAMMSMEPAEQAMHLKEALAKSGKEYASMSRQERQLLAEQMGMTDDALAKMMDPSNTFDKKGMDEMDKGVDAATKSTMSQTKATKELTKAIKKMNEAGQSINYNDGFFGAFSQGVADGLLNSKEMRKMMADVRKGFDAMYRAGRDVGKMLGELFGPGGPLHFLMEYFEEIGAGAEQMADRVRQAFRKFVDTLMGKGGADPTTALRGLFEDLFGVTKGEDKKGGGKLLEGFSKLFDLIGANILKAAPMIMKKLIGLFESITAMLTGKGPSLGDKLGKDAIFPMMQEAFAELKESGTLDAFGTAFMDMMTAFWDKFGPGIETFLGYILAGIIGAAFVQSIPVILAGGLLKGAMTSLGGATAKLLGKATGGGGAAGAAGNVTNYNIPKKGIIEQFGQMIKEFGKMSIPEIGKAALVIVAIGAGLTVALILLAKGIKEIAATGASPMMIGAVAAMIYAMGPIMNAVSRIMDSHESSGAGGFKSSSGKLTANAAGKIVVAIGATILIMGAVALIVTLMAKEFASIKISDPKAFQTAVEGAGSLTMTVLKATAAIVAMGAVIALVSAIPGGALVLAAAIAAGGVVFGSVALLIKEIVDYFTGYNAGEADSAAKSAKAAGIIVELVSKTLDQVQRVVAINMRDPKAFDNAMTDLVELVDSITNKMMPAIIKVAASITEDPQIIKDKMSIFTMLVNAFSPIAQLFSAALGIKDMNPEEAGKMVGIVGRGIESLLEDMGGFVRGIIDKIGGLSKSEIDAAKAAGPMISALAQLMGSLPFDQLAQLTKSDTVTEQYQTGKLETGIFSDTDTRKTHTRTRVINSAADKQKEFIAVLVKLIDSISPALKRMAESMAKIDFGGMSPEYVSRKMEAISKIMAAVSASSKVLGEVSDLKGKGYSNTKIKTTFFEIGRLFEDSNTGKSIITSLQPMVSAMKGVNANRDYIKAEQGTKRLTAFMSALNATFFNLGGVSETQAATFGTRMTAIIDGLAPLKGKMSKGAIQPLLDVVKAFNDLGEELEQPINFVNVGAVLKNVAGALKIEDEQLTVKRGNINVAINLNVTMKTEDVANILVDGEYVLPGRKGTGLIDNKMDRRKYSEFVGSIPGIS